MRFRLDKCHEVIFLGEDKIERSNGFFIRNKPTLVMGLLALIIAGTADLFAGFFMALTYSLDDFAVTFFVTGNGFSTLSVEIYSMARQGISLTINALSTLLFLFTILLVIGYYFITQRSARPQKMGVRE